MKDGGGPNLSAKTKPVEACGYTIPFKGRGFRKGITVQVASIMAQRELLGQREEAVKGQSIDV